MCVCAATVKHQMDSGTLEKLCSILSESHIPWMQLAEKLGMRTLAHLYEECPSPCQNLLQNYQVRHRARVCVYARLRVYAHVCVCLYV